MATLNRSNLLWSHPDDAFLTYRPTVSLWVNHLLRSSQQAISVAHLAEQTTPIP